MTEYKRRLFLTGASGLLGRAIYSRFIEANWDVYGVALTRVREGLHKLDLTDEDAVIKAILDYRPSFVIHTAAQRYPDVVEKNPKQAELINVKATKYVAKATAALEITLLYISTDYVFDGKSAPYNIDVEPKPINAYGKTKVDGEIQTLLANLQNLVLRVPVLYGPVEKLSESAVTVLFEALLNTTKKTKISNYEKRNPSHVNDIAHICFKMALVAVEKKEKGPTEDNILFTGFYHWCGSETFTKYEMVLKMAEIFNLPHSHIIPDNDTKSSVSRPYDTRLVRTALEDLGFGQHTPFAEGIREVLTPWLKK